MRRRHPWLTTARSEMLELTNERAILRSRPAEGTREESQGDAFGPEPFLDLRIDLTDAANPQVRITDPDGAELFAR